MRVSELPRLEAALSGEGYIPGLAPQMYFEIFKPWKQKKATVYAGSILKIVKLDTEKRTISLQTHLGIWTTTIRNGDVLWDYAGEAKILYRGKTPLEWDDLQKAQAEPIVFRDKLGVQVEIGDTVVYAPATRGATTIEVDVVERMILGSTGMLTLVFQSGRRFSRTEQEYDQVAQKTVYRMSTDALVVLKKGEPD